MSIPADEPSQFEFDFEADGNQNGYANWQKEQRRLRQRVKETWRVLLDEEVVVTVTGINHDIRGKLQLAEYPRRFNRRDPLKLRIGKIDFEHTDMLSCKRL